VSQPIDPCSTAHLTTAGQRSAHEHAAGIVLPKLQRTAAFLALGAAMAPRPMVACRLAWPHRSRDVTRAHLSMPFLPGGSVTEKEQETRR
tara:strand:+ start:11444 stop:11713 length:270 start_codon:yes stop_codon:yes gene_type:complete